MSALPATDDVYKVDFKELFHHLYATSERRVEVVNVPRMHFIVCPREGDKYSQESFIKTARVLRRISLGVQMDVRSANVMEYTSMPLEVLWKTGGESAGYEFPPKSWMFMVMQPVVNRVRFEKERERMMMNEELPDCPLIELKSFHEGLSVQILHQGPVREEPRARERLTDFIMSQGYQARGEPHTIYLYDPGEADENALRAIIRQPVATVAP